MRLKADDRNKNVDVTGQQLVVLIYQVCPSLQTVPDKSYREFDTGSSVVSNDLSSALLALFLSTIHLIESACLASKYRRILARLQWKPDREADTPAR